MWRRGRARPTLILMLAVLAAGCAHGSHRPTSFATCGNWSGGTGIEALEPKAFDCLAGAYREGCTATDVTISPRGVDTFERYHLWLYRSGKRCVGNLVLDVSGPIGPRGTMRADCGDLFLVGTGRSSSRAAARRATSTSCAARRA